MHVSCCGSAWIHNSNKKVEGNNTQTIAWEDKDAQNLKKETEIRIRRENKCKN